MNKDEIAKTDQDTALLHQLGYAQELWRRMGGFANFAVSFTIISILTGAITSYDQGLSAAGPAEMGIGWPIVSVFSLLIAMSLAEIASAFPTAGGLYHWSAILGGVGWGWWTAWFNLLGLVTVLAAINFGAVEFLLSWLVPALGHDLSKWSALRLQALKVGITAVYLGTQGWVNHRGIRLTAILTDLSVWVHMAGAALLTGSLLILAKVHPLAYAFEVVNRTGMKGSNIPLTPSNSWALVLGFLMAAYTMTGYDASAHTAEETVDAANTVPWGMAMSVVVSALTGYAMVLAITLAIPDLEATVTSGRAVAFIMERGLPPWLYYLNLAIISFAQYFCGLATVTSVSRMIYAFARDGGLPRSALWKQVSPRFRTPAPAIWLGCGLASLFTIYAPFYTVITSVATISLYISYGIPAMLGLFARGKTWTRPGPWSLGWAGRPVAALALVWIILVCVVGVQPPNSLALWTLMGCVFALAVGWFGGAKGRFKGPPRGDVSDKRREELRAIEAALVSGQRSES
jgi:amino acid transporter